MGLLAPVATLLGIEVETLMQRAKQSAFAYAAIGLFALICLTFLLVALYNWLSGWIGPLWAPLAIAGAALIIALVLLIALRVQEGARKQQAARRRKEAESTALAAGAALGVLPQVLRSPLLRNVGLPIALYAGFMLLTGNRKNKPDRG